MAVKVLKLDPADADLPKIETMTVENVIAAVVKTKGVPAGAESASAEAASAACLTDGIF